jgi:cytochrome c oxidase cbb3-type subunit 3/ubiquinol-cytochrome c reductase cytochrome c subunit
MEFAALYKQNCAACHGKDGENGLAVSLANPVYIAIAGKEAILRATAHGGPGRLMPAFAKTSGGTLTDAQIEALAGGIVREWGRAEALHGLTPPPYAAVLLGDANAGKVAFDRYCARCHVTTVSQSASAAAQMVKPGPVTDPDYLALISDQGLRSTILSGRPENGMPDWRGFSPTPLADQQVTDIVSYLASLRKRQSPTPQANATSATAISTAPASIAKEPVKEKSHE